jgi:hypothetical protein
MRDFTATVIAIAITLPLACRHEDRDPESPAGRVPGRAGGDVGPGPDAPVVPGVPNASSGEPPGAFDTSSGPTLTDSRNTIKPDGISRHPAGSGGTLGTGGSGGTGLGGVGGNLTGGLGTGGSAIAH